MGFWRGGEVEGGLDLEVVLPQNQLEDGEVGGWSGEIEGVLEGRHFAPEHTFYYLCLNFKEVSEDRFSIKFSSLSLR